MGSGTVENSSREILVLAIFRYIVVTQLVKMWLLCTAWI
jgi:hypothetical protein